MSELKVLACRSGGVEETKPDWAPLDPGTEPSTGAKLAILGGAGGVTVLLVELEPGGFIAEHATPETAICHVVEGGGTVFLPDGIGVPFEQGDTIEFAGELPHGWQGGSGRTLLAVTTYADPRDGV